MRLIKKKITKQKEQKSTIIKKVGAKVAGVALASSILFSSMFGLTSCESKMEANKEKVRKENEMMQVQSDLAQLSSLIRDLKVAVATTDANNEDMIGKIEDLEAKVSNLEIDKNFIKETMEEISTLIKTIQEDVEEQNSTVENKLAKIEARMAIENCLETYHTKTKIGEYYQAGNWVRTAPNGDAIYSFTEKDDYRQLSYYNKDLGLTFSLVNGEEIISTNTTDTDYARDQLVGCLYSEDAVLKEINNLSSDSKEYVFEDPEGYTIMISTENGVMTNYKVLNPTSKEVSWETQRVEAEDYASELRNCKLYIQSIGIYEDLQRDLEYSLNFKYAKCEASEKDSLAEHIAYCSGLKSAYKSTWSDESSYEIGDKNGWYAVVFDKYGKVTNGYGGIEISNSIASFKEEVIRIFYYSSDGCKIEKDEESGEYVIQTKLDDGEEFKFEIAIKEDSSVAARVINSEGELTLTLTKASKAEFEQFYNQISFVVEKYKANLQESGIIQ